MNHHSNNLFSIAIVALIAGCGGAVESTDFEAMRGAGKADGFVDPTLSCQGSCGSLAIGGFSYCGCDALCSTYGDCCNDKQAVCDGTDPKAACLAIDDAYKAEVAQSNGCTDDSQCTTFVGGTLTCGHPTMAINAAYETQVKAFGQKWWDQQCHQLDWNCPMFSPLPPWIETRGVCKQGTCAVEYVDTRGAQEGEACGDDINVQCGDGMYCAFGLNWCGTPPVTGICRKMGNCGAPSDCLNQNNDWIHPMCLGEATCSDDGKCGWSCGGFPN